MDNRKWFTEEEWEAAQIAYRRYREAYHEKYGEYPKHPVRVLAGVIKKH